MTHAGVPSTPSSCIRETFHASPSCGLGVIASMQPSHAISDLRFAPRRLGLERLAGAYAWRSLLDTGAVLVGGSDAPVERGEPLIEFYAAVVRRDLQGFAGEGWHLEQAP